MNKNQEKRGRTVQPLKKLIADGDLENAEKELRELKFDIQTFYLWLSGSELKRVIDQYSSTARIIIDAATKHRINKTDELIVEAILGHQLQAGKLIESANRAAAELGSTGSTTIDGNQLDGPAAFDHFCKQWQTTQQKFIHCVSLQSLAHHPLELPFQDLFGESKTAKTSSTAIWQDAHAKFASGMRAALIEIIDAETSHVSADDLPQKYAQFTGIVGEQTIHLSDPAFLIECENALTTMAKKDSGFKKRVDNYRKATFSYHFRSTPPLRLPPPTATILRPLAVASVRFKPKACRRVW